MQGEENIDNDFYFKECPDGSVVFESIPNKGKFITVPCGKQLIRNFNINLLVCVYMCNYLVQNFGHVLLNLGVFWTRKANDSHQVCTYNDIFVHCCSACKLLISTEMCVNFFLTCF